MPSFHFKGKSFLENYHHTVRFHKLKPQIEKGVNKTPSLTDNLLLHGDNLKALKALLPTHAGKVKCIYIDPPYNTGNEGWTYNDNVASPMIQEWLGKEVGLDDLTRHDKWCCMMYPRLVLLRELLKENGVIFASIDDNEAHHLRMMMDEIFGADNCIGEFVVVRAEGGGLAKQYVKGHDYILVYAKNQEQFEPLRREKEIRGKIIERDGKQFWLETDWLRKEFGKYGTCHYEEIEKIKGKSKKDEIDEGIFKGEYMLVKQKNDLHAVARLRSLENNDGSKFYSVLKYLSTEGSKDLEEIGLTKKFDYPKPVSLLKFLTKGATFSSKDDEDIILDSFAGSGTTAHAVLALNQEDGGNRKFILVECEDYANTITAERIRRVIKGVPNAKDAALQKGLGGSFSYYELGEELEMDKLLEGEDLPSFDELARYAFFTATGENWDESKKDTDSFYIGSSSTFEVFQLYTPDKEKLKKLALNLDFAMKIQARFPNRQKLVFAPACFMEEYHLKEFGIRFAQLPFEIYRMAE